MFHKGLFQTVPDFSVDLIHVQNKWSCLHVVNQLKVSVTVVILMICLNVAVYRSTRAGKRLFIKLALPLFMLSKKYGHLCNADTWLCPWYRADYYFVTLCFQENPDLFTKTNSNTVISELISDDQDSATDDFPPAAAVALAVCLTAVVVIVVVFVWRTRKSRRRPEARKLLYAPGPHKPRI